MAAGAEVVREPHQGAATYRGPALCRAARVERLLDADPPGAAGRDVRRSARGRNATDREIGFGAVLRAAAADPRDRRARSRRRPRDRGAPGGLVPRARAPAVAPEEGDRRPRRAAWAARGRRNRAPAVSPADRRARPARCDGRRLERAALRERRRRAVARGAHGPHRRDLALSPPKRAWSSDPREK